MLYRFPALGVALGLLVATATMAADQSAADLTALKGGGTIVFTFRTGQKRTMRVTVKEEKGKLIAGLTETTREVLYDVQLEGDSLKLIERTSPRGKTGKLLTVADLKAKRAKDGTLVSWEGKGATETQTCVLTPTSVPVAVVVDDPDLAALKRPGGSIERKMGTGTAVFTLAPFAHERGRFLGKATTDGRTSTVEVKREGESLLLLCYNGPPFARNAKEPELLAKMTAKRAANGEVESWEGAGVTPGVISWKLTPGPATVPVTATLPEAAQLAASAAQAKADMARFGRTMQMFLVKDGTVTNIAVRAVSLKAVGDKLTGQLTGTPGLKVEGAIEGDTLTIKATGHLYLYPGMSAPPLPPPLVLTAKRDKDGHAEYWQGTEKVGSETRTVRLTLPPLKKAASVTPMKK